MANQVIKRIKVNGTTYDIQPAVIDAETIPSSIARLASPIFSGTPTAPTPSSGDNSTNIATTAFVQAAINGIGAAANALRYKGVVSLEDPFPSIYTVGDVYKVAVAGEYLGQYCEVGDMFICTNGSENASQNIANDWNIIQVNETGNLSGPNSSTNNNLVAFDGTAGNIVKDSGVGVETSLTSNSDATIPTSKAVATYITNQGFAIANNLNLGAAAQKGVISNISENNNSTDLPTAAAVYNFVIGQNYLTSNDLSLGDAAEKNIDTTLTGKSNSTNLPTSKAILDYGFMTQNDVSSYLTDNNYLTTNDVTIGAAAAKGIDTAISDEATNNNVPTSLAVYEFVNNFDFSSFITDEKVKQTNSTTNATYNLLFSSSTNTTTEKTEGTYKSGNLTYNPNTKALNIGTNGTINGYGFSTTVEEDSNDLITSGAVFTYINNNDKKVTQTITAASSTYNKQYGILFSSTDGNNTLTEEARKSQYLKFNPYSKKISTDGTNFYAIGAAAEKGVDTSISNNSTDNNLPTSLAVYNYINGLGLTNVAPAPIVRTTSSITSSTSYVTLNFSTSIPAMSEGQLLFVTLSAALTSTKYARLSVGGNYLKIYVNSSDYLYASYPANTVLGLVYIDGKLIMINPPIAG